MTDKPEAKPDRVPLTETTPEKAEAPHEPDVFAEATSHMDDLDFHRVADWFDIAYPDRADAKLSEQITELRKWAKEKTGSDDRVDQMTAIRELKKGLGLTIKGEELVKKLYRYIRLDSDRKRIEKEMENVVL